MNGGSWLALYFLIGLACSIVYEIRYHRTSDTTGRLFWFLLWPFFLVIVCVDGSVEYVGTQYCIWMRDRTSGKRRGRTTGPKR